MLTLYQDYSRQEVHALLDPNTPYIPQAGSWGLHGIVSLPDRPNDFVFFVTYGKNQGNYTFDESITKDGVLSWQSQPSQDLKDKRIQKFINHDADKNVIYLFLRVQRDKKYTYLGSLKYLAHDIEREKPVHFEWQIIEGPPTAEVCNRIGLELIETGAQYQVNAAIKTESAAKKDELQFELPSAIHGDRDKKKSAAQFKAYKKPDYAERDKKNRDLGVLGEILVVEYERKLLLAAGRSDLTQKIIHVSDKEGDGAGYDVLSYHIDGRTKYIEVKTTRGGSETDFFLSPNEIEFSHTHAGEYFLYRVYEYNEDLNTGKFFTIVGDIRERLQLIPQSYRAKIKS